MKKIGIGYENYRDFIDQDLYYVDKTLFIRDILEKGGIVTLLTRPRRFGKSLNLSMLKTFFEMELDEDGNIKDNSRYFTGMKVMECGVDVLSKMGKYPVIKLSLKGAKQPDFSQSFLMLRKEIIDEYSRHSYLKDSTRLDEKERQRFRELWLGENDWSERAKKFTGREEREYALREECGKYAASLKELSYFLKKHHGTNTIILIDEYDVPLENAWQHHFYDEMVSFIRSLFESALKTNDSLEFAVITGCLRISKESIFTGMNNLNVISIRSDNFAEAFGFTEGETMQMLADYGIAHKADEVRKWYDGYLFGNQEIYNPWSVTKYVYGQLDRPDSFPEPYWSNTSSNSIIKELILRSNESIREELDILIQGGTIEKRIHEDITYADVYETEDNIWNFLFFTGYMKKVSERWDGEDIFVSMRIPNLEVKSVYRHQIRSWFDRIVVSTDRNELYAAIIRKDTEAMENILTDLLEKSISTFDSDESFYHGYLLSMLTGFPSYGARANREEGDGRPDIVLYPTKPRDPAYIFELKVRKKYNRMADGLSEAYDQIETRRYEDGILDDGYAGVVSFAICFCKKSCIAGLYTHR